MKTLGLIFRSLYKNDVCVEAGRKYAWWAALLIFLFSTIVSIIPITTTTLTVDGGSILTGANYELDESLYRFTSDLNQGELIFEDDEVVYEYKKKEAYYLIEESLTINNSQVLFYNYFDKKDNFVDKSLIGNLQIELLDNKLSIIKYIYRNTPTNQDSPLYKMMIFVENMLWYRGLSDGNAYCGFSNGGTLLVEGLYSSGKKEEFKKFLADNDLHYELEWRTNNGLHELMAKFPTGKKAPFVSIASTGTMSLFLYFFWSITAFNKISFLFIDEFDAFFHYESAENIVLRLNANKNFQTLLTSHNTYLMQNKLTRPDCCYIMTQNKITSLFNSTKKEIREAHNLEKMYINGAFNE